MSKALIECVPNFSEGRDREKIERIVRAFRGKQDLKLLDYHSDYDLNRLVVTLVGDPTAVKAALLEAISEAISLIDMTRHQGQHPRMGAVDIVPFIPIRNFEMDAAVTFSRTVAKEIADRFQIPIFLYEASANRPERKNLADIRRGEFEGMPEKLKQPEWTPDFGPQMVHPTAGVTAVGARMPLIAFNVNLNTTDLHIASAIAKRIRHKDGGLRFCKAMAVSLKESGRVQVSMNLTDFTQTPIYQALELIRVEAHRYGITVSGSEIVGLAPMAAIVESAAYYLGLENFSPRQVLESHLIAE